MDTLFLNLVQQYGLLTASILFIIFLLKKYSPFLYQLIKTPEWRTLFVRNVLHWNEDLFKGKNFREETTFFLNQFSAQDTHNNIVKQVSSINSFHKIVEKLFDLQANIQRVTLCRVHNGEKNINNEGVYKITCVIEKNADHVPPLFADYQALPLELLPYTFTELLNSPEDVLTGCFQECPVNELNMINSNQSYKQIKRDETLLIFVALIKNIRGMPLGVVEVYLNKLLTLEEIQNFKRSIIKESAELKSLF